MTVLKRLCNLNLESIPFWPMVGHSETLFMMEKNNLQRDQFYQESQINRACVNLIKS